MIDRQYLMTTKQVAEFVHHGLYRVDNAIPRELCDAVYAELEDGRHRGGRPREQTLAEAWPADSAVGEMIQLPVVQGLIESLVGPGSRYDHHAAHTTQPGSGVQHLHADAEIDLRPHSFDVQLSFFPQDTPAEMGGTRFLPGSHFRRVHESMVGRYHHVKGMMQIVCEAGTVVIWHHNLWHGAQPNCSDRRRYMFKLRLNPMVKQQLLWNTDDLNDPAVVSTLTGHHPWYGQQGRIEQFNRIRLWRFMTANPDFDFGMWYSRVENDPEFYADCCR